MKLNPKTEFNIASFILMVVLLVVAFSSTGKKPPPKEFPLQLYVDPVNGNDVDNDCVRFTQPCKTLEATMKSIDVIPHNGVQVNAAPGCYGCLDGGMERVMNYWTGHVPQ